MRRGRGEEGVSAIIVSVSLFALFGSALLSVDAGSVWTTRRSLIAHTDAAALAAARHIDAGGAQACAAARGAGTSSGAATEARELLTADDSGATLEDLEVFPYGGDCSHGAGHVRVSGRERADLAFAGLFGIDDVSPFASSTAQYGPIAAAGGLRPIAICDKTPHFAEWTAHLRGDDVGWGSGPGHRVGANGAIVHRIMFQKGSSGCGEASGNWDWLDFNDNTSPNGNSALRDWLVNGYQGVVSLGDGAQGIPPDCNPERSGRQESCGPKTGAGGGSFLDALEYLRDSGIVFPIVVYDKVVDQRDAAGCDSPPPWTGSGSNARFCPAAFLLVRLHAWDKITGQLGDDSWFEFEFIDDWWVGQVGIDPGRGRETIHGVQLCGTDYGGSTDHHCDV